MFLYTITNLITKTIYIGQTKNVNRRFSDHKNELENNKHFNSFLQHSWNKYGGDNFVFTVIECILNKNQEYLNYREEVLINTSSNIFNIRRTVEGPPAPFCRLFNYPKCNLHNGFKGKKHSEETRLILSKATLKNYEDPNYKNPFLGKKHSKESKIKMSAKVKEYLEHNDVWNKGKICSEEEVENLRTIAKNYHKENPYYMKSNYDCTKYRFIHKESLKKFYFTKHEMYLYILNTQGKSDRSAITKIIKNKNKSYRGYKSI